jgi:NAD(P)-dependent dehydrogenase (short-subunit alcohol dehydrogenase family)
MSQFAGRSIVITGATSGIGEATAYAFGREGARVAIVGRRADKGEEVARQTRDLGGEAIFIQADMRDDADIKRMVETVVDKLGRLDFAFNNAGMFGPEAPHHAYDDEVWDEWMTLNLKGVYRCMKYELAAMMTDDRHDGPSRCIINNASIMGQRGSQYAGPAYAASKHGVIGLTQQGAISYARENIRVNSVSPGPTVTEITAATAALPDEMKQQVINDLLPIGRMGEAEEVAAAVLFLCSPGASMITGQDIAVDGGQLAKL